MPNQDLKSHASLPETGPAQAAEVRSGVAGAPREKSFPGFSEIVTDATLQFSPAWRTSAIHWQPFVPFAAWLIEVLRPRSYVELGVFRGDSYCAICQAIARHATGTRCWGVDLWRGDAHVGEYGQEVFDRLSDYHDPLYGHFSRLLQMSFEEAVNHFDDGSVDLLHIDGHHSYESVKSDYETWRPKLSDRAVVLFHDVGVLERGFGVHRFVGELFETLPKRGFVLDFGAGLAVAVLAKSPPPALAYLCEAPSGEYSRYAQLFKVLGDRVVAQSKLDYFTVKDGQRPVIEELALFKAYQRQKDEAQDRAIHGLQEAFGKQFVGRLMRAIMRRPQAPTST